MSRLYRVARSVGFSIPITAYLAGLTLICAAAISAEETGPYTSIRAASDAYYHSPNSEEGKGLNLYSLNFYINGHAAETGDEVGAFNAVGVLKGCCSVRTAGKYGYMAASGNNGDVIHFRVISKSGKREYAATGPYTLSGVGMTYPSVEVGITTGSEYDSDGDGMCDYWEWRYSEYFDPAVWNDPDNDTDGDGLNDIEEYSAGSNPVDGLYTPTPAATRPPQQTPTPIPTGSSSGTPPPTVTAFPPEQTAAPTPVPTLSLNVSPLIAGRRFELGLDIGRDITQPFDFYLFATAGRAAYTILLNGFLMEGVEALYSGVPGFPAPFSANIRPAVVIPPSFEGMTISFYAVIVEAGKAPIISGYDELSCRIPRIIWCDSQKIPVVAISGKN